MTDFVATGSHDGYLRLWNANAEDRVLSPTASIPIDGFINSIAISKRLIVLGVGNEHRLGRWWRLKNVKNCVKVIKLSDYVDPYTNGMCDTWGDDDDDNDNEEEDDEEEDADGDDDDSSNSSDRGQ
jgi:WD40 repeat protein